MKDSTPEQLYFDLDEEKQELTGNLLLLMTDIPTGKENGIKGADLAEAWKTDKRQVSAVIEKLRRAGVLIASGNSGYYMPATDEELEEFYHVNRARALSLLTTLKSTRLELERRKERKLNEQSY